MIANYPLNWLDQHGQVKPPRLLYLLFAFLSKAYLVWIVSLTWHQDRAAIVQLLYPKVDDFMLHLALGLSGLVGFVIVLCERRRKPVWARYLFLTLPWLLWATLIAQLVSWGFRVWQGHGIFAWGIALEGLLLFWFALYLSVAKQLKAYYRSWTKDDI